MRNEKEVTANKERSIRLPMILSYLALFVMLAGMLCVLKYERGVTTRIEAESNDIRVVHKEISAVHHRITELAMRGETAMVWTEADRQRYDSLISETDSMLVDIKTSCRGYVRPSLIDSVCTLLGKKEQCLVDIMVMVERHKTKDKHLLKQLPQAVKKATEIKVEKRKKSGLAGLLGGKKKVTVVPTENDKQQLTELNDKIASRHEQRHKDMAIYTDSLRKSNSELNTRISNLITELDTQTQKTISDKESRISEARARTLYVLAGVAVIALIAIALLTLNIRRELKRRRKYKEERERLIGELEQSNDEKDELIKTRRQIMQTVTHELRTPLTTIMGNAELITRTSGEEKTIEQANVIESSAKRMADMTDNLLGYFRLDSMKETVVKSPFPLSSVAEILESSFKGIAAKKEVGLEIVDNTDGIIVDSDKEMLLRIGSNLLSNAIKFTEEGKVTLRTSYKDGRFSMTVEDTGVGIDDGKKDSIFTPFTRLQNSASKQGFGLGLTIVKELVDLLDGEIQVVSEKWRGSRFVVTIPMDAADGIRKTGTTATAKVGTISGIRSVIAIDDSNSNLNMLKEMLAIYNIRCRSCKDVATLTKLLIDGDYDMLVTDLRMDGMSGYDILHLLRNSSMKKLKEMPVIAMTAIDNSKEEELLAEGFTACLFKPFSIADLMESISKCTSNTHGNINIDFTTFLAYGDGKKKLSVLIDETKEDIARMKEALATNDRETMRSIVHKLGGTWMLLKADAPLNALGNILKDDNAGTSVVTENADAVIATGESIVVKANEIKERL